MNDAGVPWGPWTMVASGGRGATVVGTSPLHNFGMTQPPAGDCAFAGLFAKLVQIAPHARGGFIGWRRIALAQDLGGLSSHYEQYVPVFDVGVLFVQPRADTSKAKNEPCGALR